jgi:hypothetical protein
VRFGFLPDKLTAITSAVVAGVAGTGVELPADPSSSPAGVEPAVAVFLARGALGRCLRSPRAARRASRSLGRAVSTVSELSGSSGAARSVASGSIAAEARRERRSRRPLVATRSAPGPVLPVGVPRIAGSSGEAGSSLTLGLSIVFSTSLVSFLRLSSAHRC